MDRRYDPADPAKPGGNAPIVIGMLWHSLDSGNLGVGALTVANIAIAREVALGLRLSPRFAVMAQRDRDMPAIAVPDTEVFALTLARRVPLVLSPQTIGPFTRTAYQIPAAKSDISGLDMLVAARMHVCIGAHSAGMPVVPVAYSRKFSGPFGLLGYDAMVPMRGLDGAFAFIMQTMTRRANVAAQARAWMTRVQALLDVYRDALRDVFRKAVGEAAA